LVVLDEIGRGTSTFDGMSLAQAILEHLVVQTKSTTLFATHYHELTSLDRKYANLKNAHMSIDEAKNSKDIRFTYILSEGPANRSYGIHVARLAGLPKTITERASKILAAHESGMRSEESAQLSLEPQPPVVTTDFWAEEIKKLNLNSMTPMEALNTMSQWQENLS
jgi:DNA mismatch repair protein MutS